MKNFITRLLLPVTLLAASAQAHTVVYPHGHPHAATLSWADVLITGGVIGLLALGAVTLLRLRDREKPIHQRVR